MLSLVDILIIFSFIPYDSISFSKTFASKSILFNNIIDFLFLANFKISISSSSSFLLLSNIAITRSDSSAIFLDLSIPICSTLSSEILIPAVSISFNGIPFILTNSSIVSLVVPANSVTIARSSFKIRFSSDDFPTFGFPIIAVLIPSFRILPLLKVFANSFNLILISLNSSFKALSDTSGVSYSG